MVESEGLKIEGFFPVVRVPFHMSSIHRDATMTLSGTKERTKMSYYDASVGACGPIGCAAPVYPNAYAPYSPYGPYVAPAYPLAGPVAFDIVGQAPPAPAPTPGIVDRTRAFLGQETAGIKNQNLLLGAAALGALYYGYQKNWFGGRRGR